MGREIRAIIDCNGSLLETEGDGHLATGTLTPYFVDTARTLAQRKTLSMEKRLGMLIGADVNLSVQERLVEQLFPMVHHWKVLTNEYYSKQTPTRRMVRDLEQWLYSELIGVMFDGYSYSHENAKGLRDLKQAGVRNTLCTGIDFIVKEHLLRIIASGLQNLDQDFGIVMKPKYSSGILTKSGLAILCEDGLGEEVHAFEDDLKIAVGIVVNTQKAQIWMPISLEKGLNQRSDWTPPDQNSTVWHRIHPSHTLQDMARRIAA